ncbi:MAG: glycoside hydrolase family 43 protein [Oscillospiraceae bacterium]|nr:glycoside hydrolase family 43 protein [Oscillospiraceae bacterium]
MTGFHPDPSMIFVDGVFYIANSTFEYYPAVKISKSVDLANWETVCYPLTSQIQLRGALSQHGVWAPCLSYSGGAFYLAFTDVKTAVEGPSRDTPNYISRASNPEGPWSEAIYVNSSGFDPSLFHDDDGRKYFVNMEWDYRKDGIRRFTGILLTELDPVTLHPVSAPLRIFPGTSHGLTEGPHLYKKDGYYYLLTAEGGTSYNHAVTVARSKHITGPYETGPQPFLLTAKDAPEAYLQKCGHGSLCRDDNGRWWVAFLCSRPLPDTRYCNLGRETGIAEVVWEKEAYPRLKNGSLIPDKFFDGYGEKMPGKPLEFDFSKKEFHDCFQSLRVPAEYDLLENGALRLYGKEFINSRNFQNMLVTRQRSFRFVAETAICNVNRNYRCFGGLIFRYSEENQYYLQFAYNDEAASNELCVLKVENGVFSMMKTNGDKNITIGSDTVHLRLSVNGATGYFSYSMDGVDYEKINLMIDTQILSDDAPPTGFTGSFVGMAASDLEYNKQFCDFLYFRYQDIL